MSGDYTDPPVNGYEPKAGDTVDVTVRGRWQAIDDAWSGVETERALTEIWRDAIVRVEKVPTPLPKTPGSVVRHRASGKSYARFPDYWRNTVTDFRLPLDTFVPGYYAVLFDAGKATP